MYIYIYTHYDSANIIKFFFWKTSIKDICFFLFSRPHSTHSLAFEIESKKLSVKNSGKHRMREMGKGLEPPEKKSCVYYWLERISVVLSHRR